MTGVKILAGVILALFLIGLIRVGGEAEYSGEGLWVKVRAGFLRFQVYPISKKKKAKRKGFSAPDKGKSSGAVRGKSPDKVKKGGALQKVKEYLPLVCEAAGELKRKIRVDRLYLDLTVASGNAAETAMAYGYANMALGMLWPLIEQNFEVKEPRIRTALDFNASDPTVYISAAFSARLGQLTVFALRFGWKLIGIYGKNRSRAKNRKEAI